MRADDLHFSHLMGMTSLSFKGDVNWWKIIVVSFSLEGVRIMHICNVNSSLMQFSEIQVLRDSANVEEMDER